ncbi:MAG: epoxyqueuosine reductase QueH [Treponema sp.]|jgi:predicted adenine nucleotide alpha hydrolase (AANH) superfamily ATPase|nr:epoxyqueuosine reductase QueH [Treponema sp.]
MKLLLHTCCAPCAISCVKSIKSEGIEPVLFWYNPNIHPYIEYKARFDSLSKFANNENLKLITQNEYGLKSFLNDFHPNTKNRCENCYRMRLEKTVSIAAREGFSTFSTTLLISPYQDHKIIKQIGEETGAKYDLQFFYTDFRPLFREGQSSARTSGFYMQKYCGCIFSEEERYIGEHK